MLTHSIFTYLGLHKLIKKYCIPYTQIYLSILHMFSQIYNQAFVILCDSMQCFYFNFIFSVCCQYTEVNLIFFSFFFLCIDLLYSGLAKFTCQFLLDSLHIIAMPTNSSQFYIFLSNLYIFYLFFLISLPWLVPQVQC